MATKLPAPPDFTRKGIPHGKPVTDFTPYTDGDSWLLERGADFTVRANTVYNNAAKYAKENGYDLDYRIYANDDDPPERIALRFRKSAPTF